MLNINPDLSPSQTEWLLKILQEHKEAFSWEYKIWKASLLIYPLITYTLNKNVDLLGNQREEWIMP